ncbi:MAG TPA: hypothetical protein VH482_17405 [Thermomicrobiales bacterium]|jgi:hypothetical protein
MNIRKGGAGLAAAGVLASTALLAAGGAPSVTAVAVPAEFRVLAITTEVSEQQKVRMEGDYDHDSVGETFAFGGNIYAIDRTAPSATITRAAAVSRRLIGTFGVSCIVTSDRREEAECEGNVNIVKGLRQGQIAVQALLAGRDEDHHRSMSRDHDDPEYIEPTLWPIVGGTGSFNATGGTLEASDLVEGVTLLSFQFAAQA